MVEWPSEHSVTSATLGWGAVVGFVLWVYLWVYVRGVEGTSAVAGVGVCFPTDQHDTGIVAIRGVASGYFLACGVLGVVLELWRPQDSDHNSDSYRYVSAMIMSLVSCAANGLSSYPVVDTPLSSFWGRRINIMRWGQWILVLPLVMYSLETQRGTLLRKRGFPFISMISFWTCVALSFALGTLHSVVTVTSFLTVTVVITVMVGLFAVVELVSSLRVYWGKDDSSSDVIGGRGMDSTIERLVMKPLLQHSMDANTMASHLEMKILLEFEHRNVVLASLFKVAVIAVVTVQVLGCTACISVVLENVLSFLFDVLAMTIYFISVYAPEMQDSAKIRDLMLKSDERNSATIKHFFRFVCHEMVPPLSDLTSSIYRIADATEEWTDADSELREDVDISVKCCTQMFKTIEDVRNFIVAIDGELYDSFGRAKMTDTLDFKREVRQTAEHYSSRAKTKGIRLILAIDPGIPDAFLGNRVKIKTAVNIIVTTGIDWCDKEGEVVIILRARPHPLDQKATRINVHFAVQISNPAGGTSTTPSSGSSSVQFLREQIKENERVLNLGVAAKLVEKEGSTLNTAVRNNNKNITISFELALSLKFPHHNSTVVPLDTEVLASPFRESETIGYSLDQWGKMDTYAPELHVSPSGSSQGLDKKELESSPSSVALNAAAAAGLRAGLRRIASFETLGGDGRGGAQVGTVDAGASASEILRQSPTLFQPCLPAVSISPVSSFTMPTEGFTSMHERPRSVLICDDSPSNRNMCSRLIAKLGYNVEVAENGEQCLKMVMNDGSGPANRPSDFKIPKENCYRAIILDNEMPVMSGPQTVRVLRSYAYSGLVIGLTGYAMEEDVNKFRAEGCDAIFIKPLNLPEMLQILKVQPLASPP